MVEQVEPIPRGQDLTREDIELLAEDFYVVRNWAALQAKLGKDGIIREVANAFEVRLGRREQVEPVTASQDKRPTDCRYRLKDEGKAYPRSSCASCGSSVVRGLSCPHMIDQ